MKHIVAIIMMLAAASAMPAATKPTAKKKAAPAPKTVTIPKDAVPNPDGNSYTYTDKQGKKWIYAKTPFGIMKNAASDPGTGAPSSSVDSLTKAIDQGDSVKFERPGPFGTISWERKKSDLTDDERRAFEAQNVKPQ